MNTIILIIIIFVKQRTHSDYLAFCQEVESSLKDPKFH